MRDSEELPLWQQQLIQKQLQGIQRKNQIQQLEPGIIQQNMLCQVVSPRQRAQQQLPPMLNGMPINNQSGFMLHSDVMHAEPKAANSSNMFMMSNNHGQAVHLHPTGFAPQQQFDQLLYGTPVSSSRGLIGHYTQLQGMAGNDTDAIDKASVHSLAHQNIQSVWSNNLEQNGVEPSQAAIGLDPEEEKFLFGKNDSGSFGIFLNDNSFKDTDCFGAFPSLNSGSWSALMQDAVQSSRNDKGFQEEWSGLSFQNPESSVAKYQVTLDNDSNNSDITSFRPLPVSDESSVKQMFHHTSQEQIQPNDASFGVLFRNVHDQSDKYSQVNWNDQESIALSDIGDQPDGNRTLFAQNGGNISSAMNQSQFDQPQSILNSNSGEEIDLCALNRYHYYHGKVAFNHSTKPRSENVEEFKHQSNKGHQILVPSMNSAEQSPSMSDSRTSSGTCGWKPVGSHIYQSPKDTDNSTTFPKSIFQKSQEQEYAVNSHLKKGHANSLDEVQHRSSMSRHPSQNMDELLQRVDSANISGPSSQIQPLSNHDLQSHASFLYSNSQQLDSIASDHSLYYPNEASQMENLEVKSFSSGQKHDDTSHIISEGNSSADGASNISYMGLHLQTQKHQQLLQQQKLLHHQRLANSSKHAGQSLLRQVQSFQNMAITNQSSLTPLPNISGGNVALHLNSIHNLKTVQTQQINSPDVLHNIWANTSSRGSNDLGTCSQDSPNFMEGDQIPAEETSLNGFDSETCGVLQDQEKTLNGYSNVNFIKHSNIPSVQQSNVFLLKQMLANKASMISNSNAANESSDSTPQLQPGASSDILEQSKRRKIERTELESWHQVVSLDIQRLQNISCTAEYGWSQATNRLIDKMDDLIRRIEDGSLVPRAGRRLILTTHLMQKLLPPIPAPILAAKVTSAYESVTYVIAKQALGDACGLICSQSDCGQDNENRVMDKNKTSKKSKDVLFSNIVEFSGKLEKLENAFSRLEKRTPFMETRLEWEEVEKNSLINQLGKIHAGNQQAGAPRREVQRFMTGFSTPFVSHGVHCLSL